VGEAYAAARTDATMRVAERIPKKLLGEERTP